MNTDTLGDRIKRYERVSRHKLTPRSPLFVRIDGKSFHTFTKGLERPFSQLVIDAMAYAAMETAKQMSGFKLGYVQSDEATFMLTDTDTLTTQGWFDYDLNKVVSISASIFTAFFNKYWTDQMSYDINDERYLASVPLAVFDSRAFTVPIEDAPNVFIWRMRDWERNSVQMYARAYFTHKECEGKKIPELHDMLHGLGLNWANLHPQIKNGTLINKHGNASFSKHNYDTLWELLDVKV